MKKIEWPTIAMMALCYGTWIVFGIGVTQGHYFAALLLMSVAAALHSSLQHEVLHGHPTKNAAFNELCVALPLSVFFPYRRFKALHLRHHHDERLCDPYDDPESWYRAGQDVAQAPAWFRALLTANNTFLGRIVFGPILMIVGFYRSEAKLLAQNAVGVRRAWAFHLGGLICLFAITFYAMAIDPLAYLAFVAYPAISIIAIRTYCEHRWHDDPDGRTIIVEKPGLLGWLFLNNNLHLVHHKLPRAPWYQLPDLYAARKADWLALNRAYVFKNYWSVARHYALRVKEPVVHPQYPADNAPVISNAPSVPIEAALPQWPTAPASVDR